MADDTTPDPPADPPVDASGDDSGPPELQSTKPTENTHLLRWILKEAWSAQPRLVQTLAIITTVAVILSFAAKSLRDIGVINYLLAFLLFGGIALLIQGYLSFKAPEGEESTAKEWARRVLFAVGTVFLGFALIATAWLVLENTTDADRRPFTNWLLTFRDAEVPRPSAELRACAPPASPEFREIGPATIVRERLDEAFPEPAGQDLAAKCAILRKRPGLRFVGTVDLTKWNQEELDLWTGVIDIPDGSTVILGDKNLALHALEIRGRGQIVGWPEDRAAADGQDLGSPGMDGRGAGALKLDVLDTVAASWMVDLVGQKGGNGAPGARGPKGSTGRKGKDAVTGPFDCRRGGRDGEKGGQGGRGEPGGAAGDGGKGGSLRILDPKSTDILLSKLRVTKNRAQPGAPGAGGPGGPGGDGGRGGRGKGFCGGGSRGPAGDLGPNGEAGAKGEQGSAPIVYRPAAT